MIVKSIRLTARPGCKDELIARQRVWNDAMSRQPGFLGVQVATDPSRPDQVLVFVTMESRVALDRFMAGDHDVVERQTDMQRYYERCEVQILDVVDPAPAAVRVEPTPSRAAAGHAVMVLAQLYRASATLRAALLSGLFDHVEPRGTPVGVLAERSGLSEPYTARLVEGLGALGLVSLADAVVTLGPLAAAHLCRQGEAWLGDLVLFDTRPAIWQHWGRLPETLGIPMDPPDEHLLFLRAMTAIARGGQAEALTRAFEPPPGGALLDVGGARGDYALALCRRTPTLRAVVLDQPATAPHAAAFIEEAGLAERVRFVAGDYRRELPGGPWDAVLLSNIVRGETADSAERLLDRAAQVLRPGGILAIQDLFPHAPGGTGPLLASLFGLHLPDAMNGPAQDLGALLERTGFTALSERTLDGYVGSNLLVTAIRR